MKDFFDKQSPTLSFEIFPPKGKGELSSIFATVDALASLAPDLISVTYGAGGTSRENTAEIASEIQNSYNIPAVAHLTCVGSTKEQMDKVLLSLAEKGVKNILALRGDLAEGESLSDFKDKARAMGISQPIAAGIMPITSASQISRMVSMCGASVPDKVQKIIRAYGHNSMAMKEAGIAYATAQIVDLLANGVDGIHLYTMNQPDIAKRISENIRGILYSLRVKRG